MRLIPLAAAPLVIAFAGLSLSACYDREIQAQAGAAAAGRRHPKRRRSGPAGAGAGDRTFLGVEITPDALIYTRVDQPTQRAPNHGATVQGTVATFASSTNLNKALNVVLIATECSDGMSDRTYPLTAKVEIGDDELTGCAAPASMLTTQPAP